MRGEVIGILELVAYGIILGLAVFLYCSMYALYYAESDRHVLYGVTVVVLLFSVMLSGVAVMC